MHLADQQRCQHNPEIIQPRVPVQSKLNETQKFMQIPVGLIRKFITTYLRSRSYTETPNVSIFEQTQVDEKHEQNDGGESAKLLSSSFNEVHSRFSDKSAHLDTNSMLSLSRDSSMNCATRIAYLQHKILKTAADGQVMLLIFGKK